VVCCVDRMSRGLYYEFAELECKRSAAAFNHLAPDYFFLKGATLFCFFVFDNLIVAGGGI
jgi:hypothetical protein